jgi:MoxR-like ATPase
MPQAKTSSVAPRASIFDDPHHHHLLVRGTRTVSGTSEKPVRPPFAPPKTPDDVRHALEGYGYLADDGLATAIFLAMVLRRPLFLEGEPGGGKTEVANALSKWTGGELVRLQCYEGIDVSQAVYEWDFARQLLHLRAAEVRGTAGGRPEDVNIVEDELFSERFLVRRPLLRAIAPQSEGLAPPVLIIDEVDRADDEFEAFLLEVLSDYSVTVPELGTFRADEPPLVVLTSNRTRDVHDALKRRCLYHWVEHPDFEREVAIVRLKAPEAGARLARQVTAAVQVVRGMGLYKAPGVAETIDWAHALAALGSSQLDETAVERTLGSILKYREDIERVSAGDLAGLVQEATRRD